MQFKNGCVPRHRKLAALGVELSSEARKRTRWFDYYASHGRNASATCRHFGISRETFHRWKRRYDPSDLSSLEDRSHQPHRVRRPNWTKSEIQAVRDAREKYPRWGKAKLAVRIRLEAGLDMSASKVGRILSDLKRRGLLVEPVRGSRRTPKKRSVPRPHASRKPKDWPVRAPGDLVQLDTKQVRPLPGVIFWHFGARDVISRYDVIEAHGRASAFSATMFLDAIRTRMPFPVRAFQVDGGSEFKAEFERACADLGIPLFVLPPRSPKLNGHIESANGCHNREFYELYDGPLTIEAINRALLRWEAVYNTVRPHQSLGYRTPAQCVEDFLACAKRPRAT